MMGSPPPPPPPRTPIAAAALGFPMPPHRLPLYLDADVITNERQRTAREITAAHKDRHTLLLRGATVTPRQHSFFTLAHTAPIDDYDTVFTAIDMARKRRTLGLQDGNGEGGGV